jgi:hypothetical protein
LGQECNKSLLGIMLKGFVNGVKILYIN